MNNAENQPNSEIHQIKQLLRDIADSLTMINKYNQLQYRLFQRQSEDESID